MSILDLFRRKKAPPPAPQAVEAVAERIIGGVPAVMQEIRQMTADPEGWFRSHQERYEERGIEGWDPAAVQELLWLGMVDILENSGHVCERDVKDELTDFLFFVGGLAGVRGKLPLDPAPLREEAYVPDWCAALDRAWAPAGYCLAAIDIGSDSYVLFPAPAADLPELDRLAHAAGYRICRGATA